MLIKNMNLNEKYLTAKNQGYKGPKDFKKLNAFLFKMVKEKKLKKEKK